LFIITANVGTALCSLGKDWKQPYLQTELSFIFCFYKFHFKNKKFEAIYNIFTSNILTKTQIEQS